MFDIDIAHAIKRLSVSIIPLLLGIILHEVAHGWMADRCGDSTARYMGRLTLNPLQHIDTTGLLFFIASAIFAPVTLGWAKPVPINPSRFRHLVRDLVAVAAAGPLSNFLLALISAGLLRGYLEVFPYQTWQHSGIWQFFFLMLYTSVSINCALAWFNLIPVPPLDGSKLLWSVLPSELGWKYLQIERYGIIIVFVLLAFGAFQYILTPVISVSVQLMLGLFGLA